MRAPLIRGFAAVTGALLVLLLVLPMSAAFAATKNNVPNGDEAWFLAKKEFLAEPTGEDPTCSLPTECNVAGTAQRPSNHPEQTMVVAAVAGDPDAQAFFNFDVNQLPFGAVVTGGKVTLPVADDPEAGNQNAAAAKMVACLVTGFIPGGADGGSYADRPSVDDSVCTPVKKEKDEPLTFSVGLERFGKVWAADPTAMNGISVMVDPDVAASHPNPPETWRVVFNTKRRAEQGRAAQKEQGTEDAFAYPMITSNLQYTVKAAGFPSLDIGGENFSGAGGGGDFSTSGEGFGGGGEDFSGGDVSGGGDFAAAPADGGAIEPPANAGEPAVQEPVAAEGAEQPVAAGPTVPANAVGLSPAVWAVPLLALGLAGAFGWSLTQPVQLAGAREGAVSKLMRTRRMAAADTPTS